LFGKNEIVGKKYFKDKTDYLVTSIFFTLQGEGPLMGQPAVFIRLAKCNLACSFCDTYFDSGDWMSLQQIDDKVNETISQYFQGLIPDWVKNKPPILVVTGGEPTLQKLTPLLDHFKLNYAATCQIESNGILPTDMDDIDTWLVVSPKVNEKTGKYIKPHAKTLERANCLKFIVSADINSPYHTIPEWAFEWIDDENTILNGGEIYISPMNMYNKEPQAAKQAQNHDTLATRSVEEVISFWTPGLLDLETNQRNHEYAGQYALQNGLRLNLQMHLYIGKA
jgi:organic radical activating enzyme